MFTEPLPRTRHQGTLGSTADNSAPMTEQMMYSQMSNTVPGRDTNNKTKPKPNQHNAC